MKILACNLKNKLTKEDVTSYLNHLENLENNTCDLIFFPSYPYLNFFSSLGLKVGSQDISSFDENTTITGEITALQLKSLQVSYTLVGHSERRIYKNEINIDFINKINHAQEQGIKIIYCIGEDKKDHDNHEVYNVLEKQISEVLNNVDLKDIIIAYEPIWAIGTNVTPTYKEIADIIEYIKDIIDEKYNRDIKVLYGGSVNKDNIAEFNNISSLDGFLVGGASLKPEEVQEMISKM